MGMRSLFSLFLDDDRLTRGLGDEEARLLVDWLVDRVERTAERLGQGDLCRREVSRMCLRLRAVGRFIWLWCYQNEPGAACQLAAAERFAWPLPSRPVGAFELMLEILDWEDADQDQRVELLAYQAAA